MSTVTSEVRAKPAALSLWDHSVAQRVSDYVELAKPRIAVMVLVTVAVGYILGSADAWSLVPLCWAWLGIALSATGASAFNQWIERHTDARMRRTQSRPLPAGRIAPWEALAFAVVTAIAGVTSLWLMVNPLTALLTAATCVLYAFVYTPLKRYTSLCTAVGAIPGALPPVLGWTAAGQPLDAAAFALFGILFLWQFPHFLAIAWLYREDYAAAGLRMLPGTRPLPHVTGLMAVAYALGLIPVSLLPAGSGLAGSWYSAVALAGGMVYLAASIAFAWSETRTSARRLLWISLVYLPVLLMVLAGDHVRLLQVAWGPRPVQTVASGMGEN
jgi:protoheme IX farnesyltransferase